MCGIQALNELRFESPSLEQNSPRPSLPPSSTASSYSSLTQSATSSSSQTSSAWPKRKERFEIHQTIYLLHF